MSQGTIQSGARDAQTSDKTKRPRRRWLRWAACTAGMLVIVPCGLLGVMLYMTQQVPDHWQKHQAFLGQHSAVELEALAEAAEARIEELAMFGLTPEDAGVVVARDDLTLVSHTTGSRSNHAAAKRPEAVRVDTIRTLRLEETELQALVHARFDEWLSERGYNMPSNLDRPMVALGNEQTVVMAFEISAGDFQQVVSAKFGLAFSADGMAQLNLKQFLVGSLPVPSNEIGKHISRLAPNDERLARVGNWLQKLKHLEFKPVMKVAHRRRATVLDYQVVDDGLVLRVRIQDHKTYREQSASFASATP